jgi:hypothetical protein
VAANAATLGALGALLAIVTFLGGFASSRLHGAYRDALRDLRESERRLDVREAGHVDGWLDAELRWLGEIRDAARDARWRESALLMALLSAVSVVLGGWALTEGVSTLDALAVVAMITATALVTLLLVLDGRRIRSTLAASVRSSRLWGLLRLENALSDVHRATVRTRAAHRAWLRARVAGHPLAGTVARWRARRFERAERRRRLAVDRLAKWDAVVVLRELAAAGVRAPAGYVEGLRGLIPLVSSGTAAPLSGDDDWNAALADLTRAVELDASRRLRWLSALAACAELRGDPAARESAARWTLEMAALAQAGTPRSTGRGPAGLAADRYDPLPDATVVEPRLPGTWQGALRRGRETGAPPPLLAWVLVRWAYALVLDRPADSDVDTVIAPAVDAAVEVMGALPEPEVDRYLRLVRAGFAELGASGVQMGRLIPPRPARPGAGAPRPPAGPATGPGPATGTGPATGAAPAGGASASRPAVPTGPADRRPT